MPSILEFEIKDLLMQYIYLGSSLPNKKRKRGVTSLSDQIGGAKVALYE